MKIEFDLLANATDSISQAIALTAWKDEPNDARRLKQAVVAIAHGIELLLKERLRRVHPVLIWENVDKFPNLSARTVTVDVALNRLIRIGGLKLGGDDVNLIASLRDTRNAIEHYVWTTTKDEVDIIIGRALEFALHFSKYELGHDFFGFGTHKDGTFEDLQESNKYFATAVKERNTRIVQVADDVKLLCAYCHALAVNPSTGACSLCGHWNNSGYGHRKSDSDQYSDDDFPF